MNQRKFTVAKKDENSRLDIFLSLINNDFSRSFVKNNIEQNNVKVNGEVEYRANYKVKEGDEIEISFHLDNNKELIAQDIPLDTIYEDEDLLVINKEPGMSVHPMTFDETDTVVNALIFKYKNMKYLGNSIRTGLIHRLDKGTSGVLLIGKTNLGLWHYSKQFASRNVSKYYLAVSSGRVDLNLIKKEGVVIENYLGRNNMNRKRFSIMSADKGKFAKSKIFYLGSNKEGQNLFLVKPYTGRTHQIRVHLASVGQPILGDKKYGGKLYDRMMLHAWRLTTTHLKGEEITFTADPPKDFQKIFKNIQDTLNDFEDK